jgi:hypothetical protein
MLKLLRFVLWVLGLTWHLSLVICHCLGFWDLVFRVVGAGLVSALPSNWIGSRS